MGPPVPQIGVWGFKVQGLRFRFRGLALGFVVWGLGFGVFWAMQCLGCLGAELGGFRRLGGLHRYGELQGVGSNTHTLRLDLEGLCRCFVSERSPHQAQTLSVFFLRRGGGGSCAADVFFCFSHFGVLWGWDPR